jgi:uncharacterized protein (DUF983 family)
MNSKFIKMAFFICILSVVVSFMVYQMGYRPPLFVTLSLLISAIVGDCVTTMRAIKLGGKEANPLVGFLFKKLGVKGGMIVAMVVMVPIFIYFFLRAPSYQQFAIGYVYWLIPINNLKVIKRLQKSKARV